MSFPENFLWGAVSTAYQVEGACHEGGKGQGIWDALSEGHIRSGDTGNNACNFYHSYKEDIALMRQMRLKACSFSVSWPRIMPQEHSINEEGIQFYKNLVQELSDAGITPVCILYDWNLPLWIHEKGGWLYEGISGLFSEFTEIVVKSLSDKVFMWITLNDPAVFIGGGYITGEYAPFERSRGNPEFIQKVCMLTKNILLAHGKAFQAICQNAVSKPLIGIAVNGKLDVPCRETKSEVEKARQQSFLDILDYRLINWWIDPIVKGKLFPILAQIVSKEELEMIHQPLDFLGYNCYKGSRCEYTDGKKDIYPGCPRTATDCPITPEILYWAVRFCYERYKIPVLISENGMANVDFEMSDGMVHDQQRIQYLKWYLQSLKRAVDENYPVMGYLYRSLFDGFEWDDGYDRRFGLVFVDYRTQERIPKDSAYWYAQIIKENGKNL